MSTPNFNITKVMDMFNIPLMVQSDEMLYKYVMEEEPTEDVDLDDFVWEVQNGFECLMCDIRDRLDELKNSLNIFTIDITDGYYTGVQFVVDTADLDTSYLNVEGEWDEWELAHYFDADTVEEARENIAKEVRDINVFLEEMKSYGFRPLNCDGVFSNGEAIYSWAD